MWDKYSCYFYTYSKEAEKIKKKGFISLYRTYEPFFDVLPKNNFYP